MISSNALRLLVKSGFVVENKWTKLTSLQGVSLEERRRLKTMASSDHDQEFKTISLCFRGTFTMVDYSSTECSWKELVVAVENYGDKDIAVIMIIQLDITDEGNESNVNIHKSLILLYRCTYFK